jgi:hypothetical protein
LFFDLLRGDIEPRSFEIIVKGGDIIPFGSDISPRRVEIIAKRDDIIPLGIDFNPQRIDISSIGYKI